MSRLALAALLLSACALADESCAADGTCQASEDENAALLQRSAAQKVEVTQHSHANTTETSTLTCYPNFATNTCGNPDLKCFQDTSGCSASGAGTCCKAAGNGAGLQQCKFCGDSTCGPCPGGPSPTPPSPTPPSPTPSGGGQQLGQCCGNWGSTGQWVGNCAHPYVCSPVANAMPGACSTCQYAPANAAGGTLGAPCQCGGWPACYVGGGLTCQRQVNAPPGSCNVCQGGGY